MAGTLRLLILTKFHEGCSLSNCFPSLSPLPSLHIIQSHPGVSYLAVGDLLNLAGSALDAHAVVLTGCDFYDSISIMLSSTPCETKHTIVCNRRSNGESSHGEHGNDNGDEPHFD